MTDVSRGTAVGRWEWWQYSYGDESSAANLHSPPLGTSPWIERMEFRLPGASPTARDVESRKSPALEVLSNQQVFELVAK